MVRFSVLLLALALAGCAGGQKITASPTFVCVEIKQYSRAEQNQMADELEKFSSEIPAVANAVNDYGSLRAALRKVCKQK